MRNTIIPASTSEVEEISLITLSHSSHINLFSSALPLCLNCCCHITTASWLVSLPQILSPKLFSELSHNDQSNTQIWPCHPHVENIWLAFHHLIQGPAYGTWFSLYTSSPATPLFPPESLVVQEHVDCSAHIILFGTSFPSNMCFLSFEMFEDLHVFLIYLAHIFILALPMWD